MNWEAIEAISGLLTTVATLVTLVYLALQIRESNLLARSASIQSVTEGFTDRSLLSRGLNPEFQETIIRGHRDWQQLRNSEKDAFGIFLSVEMMNIQNVLQLHDKALISDVDRDAWMAYAISLIVTPGGMEAWNLVRTGLTPTLVNAVEAFRLANPNAPSQLDLYPYNREPED